MNNESIFELNNEPHKGISKNNQYIEYKIIENYLIKGCFDNNDFTNPEYEKWANELIKEIKEIKEKNKK